MQYLIDFISNIVHWLFALVMAVINTIIAMLQDLICWCVDQLLSAVVYILGLLDFGTLDDGAYSAALNGLPADIWNVFWLLGLPYCMGIILTALMIRLVMQLIPFVRLGS